MQNRILVVMPTRGRKYQAQAAVENFIETSSGCADLSVLVDSDDVDTEIYVDHCRVTVKRIQRQSGMFVAFLRELILQSERYNILGFTGDDIRYRSYKWDALVADNYTESKPFVIYGPDGIRTDRLPTHPFFHKSLITVLRNLAGEGCNHYYWDEALYTVASALDSLIYLPEMRIEHLHHSVGKSAYDATYRNAEKLFESDKNAYQAYMRRAYAMDVALLRTQYLKT